MAEETGLELCFKQKRSHIKRKVNWVKEQTAPLGYNTGVIL